MMLIDKVAALAELHGIDLEPRRIIAKLYGIGYRQSASAFLIGVMEDRLGIMPDRSLTLYQRLDHIESRTVFKAEPQVLCSFNPALA